LGDGIISTMDRRSKILLWIMFSLIVLSVSSLFYKAIIKQDFEIIELDETSSEDNEITGYGINE
jgi:hypothetical protein